MSKTDLDDILDEIADAGLRMSQIDAAEGAAGNISVFHASELGIDTRFRRQSSWDLPIEAPALADGWIVITGAGRRLRDVARRPERTVCLLRIDADGRSADLYGDGSIRPTSEFNTHLAVHNYHVGRRELEDHAVVHAQPLHLSYLSHLAQYQDTDFLNRRLLRWQPEMIVEFPEGFALLPWEVPGSSEQMGVTTDALANYRAIVWARHGIVTRADKGVGKAADLIEYAETAARYEYMNLALGEPGQGLCDDELRLICERLGFQPPTFLTQTSG